MAALRNIALLLLQAIVLVGLCACSASSSSNGLVRASELKAGQPAGLDKLPVPSALRKAKVITSGVFRYGSQYASALPNQLVMVDSDLLSFTPAWLGNGLEGAAYAIYVFDSTGYATDDTLHLAWDTTGADFGDLWIGLANFAADRWDWFAGPGTGALPYAAQQYSDNGLVYAVVLCLGSDAWKLKSIRISSDVPSVVLAVSPLECIEGVPVSCSATLDGTADSYSWDFGGGADPNTSTESSPTVTPLAAGSYSASLTVANSYGSDVYGFTLVVELAETPPVAALAGNPLSGNAPLAVDYDASASFDPDDGGAPGAGIAKYEWDYTDDGAYEFDSDTDPTVSHVYEAIGSYVCRVRVTDNEGSSSTATVSISVTATFTASGYVKTSFGDGIQGVTMNFTNGLASVTTDSSGYWSRDGIPDGDYTVTPGKNGFTFDPASQDFTISGADAPVGDFTSVDLGEPNNGLYSAYDLPATGDYCATIGGSDTWDCYKFTAPSAGLMKVTYSNPITDPMVGMYLSPSDNGALLSAGVNHEVSAICRAGDTFYIGFNGSSLGADPPYSFTLSIETPAWSDFAEPNNSFDEANGQGPNYLSATYRAVAHNALDPYDYYAFGSAQFEVGTTYDAAMTYDQSTRIDYFAFKVDQTVIWGTSTILNPKYMSWTWTPEMGNGMYFAVWAQQATPHYYTFTISPSSKRAPL